MTTKGAERVLLTPVSHRRSAVRTGIHVLLLGTMIVLPACPGIDPPAGSPPPNDNEALFPEFTFEVGKGAFWEFAWRERSRTFGSGETVTTPDQGRFRLVLGEPQMIVGLMAYELLFEGRADQFRPRWSFLAFDDHRIFGSIDGLSLVKLFDGHTGSWPAIGLFHDFPDGSLVTAYNGVIDNEFISRPAIVAEVSTAQSECEFFPGIGTLCGGDRDESSTRREYYDPTIGPLGFFFSGSVSSRLGGASTEVWAGLVNFASGPTEGLDPLEIEPNDSPQDAQPIEVGSGVLASIAASDRGTIATAIPALVELAESANAPALLTAVIGDWFTFSLDSDESLNIGVFVSSIHLTDLDLFLFDSAMTEVLAVSVGFHPGGPNTPDEMIFADLSPGTYVVGVRAVHTSSRTSNYVVVVTLRAAE